MTALNAAFVDPVVSAQTAFRAIMDALARPGSVRPLAGVETAPAPLSPSAAAIALTLLDHDTPLWLDARLAASADVADWLRFHTGAPVVTDSSFAAFAIVGEPDKAPAFDAFQLGSADYPDRSTTIIFEVASLDGGEPMAFTGPGIKGRNILRPEPLPADLRMRLQSNRALFPRGVDLLLAAPGAIAALPRTVMLAERD